MQPHTHNALSHSFATLWLFVYRQTPSKLYRNHRIASVFVYAYDLANEYMYMRNFFWRNVESLRQIFALHNMIHTLCATMKTVAHSAHALHFHRIRFFSFSVQVYNVVCFRVCYTLRTKLIINNVCVCVSMPGLLNIVFVWVETELSVLIYRLALFNQFSIQTQINGRRKS